MDVNKKHVIHSVMSHVIIQQKIHLIIENYMLFAMFYAVSAIHFHGLRKHVLKVMPSIVTNGDLRR